MKQNLSRNEMRLRDHSGGDILHSKSTNRIQSTAKAITVAELGLLGTAGTIEPCLSAVVDNFDSLDCLSAA